MSIYVRLCLLRVKKDRSNLKAALPQLVVSLPDEREQDGRKLVQVLAQPLSSITATKK